MKKGGVFTFAVWVSQAHQTVTRFDPPQIFKILLPLPSNRNPNRNPNPNANANPTPNAHPNANPNANPNPNVPYLV